MGIHASPSHAGLPSKAAELSATVHKKEQALQEKADTLLQREQEVHQLQKGELSTRLAAQDRAVCDCWLMPRTSPATLGHDSALLQMHQLQRELEALRSSRTQEAAVQEDLLRLQGQEPLVSYPCAAVDTGCLLCNAHTSSLSGGGACLPWRQPLSVCRWTL